MKKITAVLLIVAVALFAADAFAKTKIKKEQATFKEFKENDPAKNTDNTVVVMKEGKEVEAPIDRTWNEKHLKFFKEKEVSITSTYNPETGSFIVTNIEPFAR